MTGCDQPTTCSAQTLADALLERHHLTRTRLSMAARGLLHPSWTTNQLATAALADLDATHPQAMPAPLPPQPLADVLVERDRQDLKWGEQNHPDGTGPSVLPLQDVEAQRVAMGPIDSATGTELAIAATGATNEAASEERVTWAAILLEEVFEALAESDPARLRTELVQVAAVAVQWAGAIDRREAPRG